MGAAFNPSNGQHSFLPLEHTTVIEARLSLLDRFDKLTVMHGGSMVDFSYCGGQNPHYLIRPSDVTAKELALKEEIMQLTPPADGKPIKIDLNEIGGRFAVGTKVEIEGVIITLPENVSKKNAAAKVTNPIDLKAAVAPRRASEWVPEGTIILSDYHNTGCTEIRSETVRNGTISTFLGIGTRSENQDLVAFIKDGDLLRGFFVLDGNHDRGDLATSIVAQHIIRSNKDGLSFAEAFSTMQREFARVINSDYPTIKMIASYQPEYPYLGTCAVGVEINGDQLSGQFIGDSRLLVVRGAANGEAKKILRTTGHNLAEELISTGLVQEEQVKGMRNKVTRMIAYPKGSGHPEAIGPIKLEKGDLVMIFSDGLFVLDEAKLLKICEEKKHGQVIAAECYSRMQDIVSARLLKKHFDNFSMAVFEFDPD